MATEKEYWPLVSAHLQGAAPIMLETHKRNLDADCREFPVLKHAAKTTDFVESQFATYDYAMRLGASFGATAGVAQSMRMHAMDTPGAKQAAAAKAVSKKRKQGLGAELTEEQQVREQVEKWDVTSFFSLPETERWAIIKSVRLAYTDTAKDERAQLLKMDRAKEERHKKARVEQIEKFENRCLNYDKFSSIDVISSVEALNALAEHVASPKDLAEALRQQTRLRIHVYDMKRALLPTIGVKPGASCQDEATRLLGFYKTHVETALLVPQKPPKPTPFPVRDPVAAPSALATELDRAHVVAISAAWKELAQVLHEGVFRAPKEKAPKKAPTQKRAKTAATGAPRAPRPPRKREASAAELELEGQEFEEDGVDWKVLAVRWCDEQGVVVVWYYDLAEAESSELSEEFMTKAIDKGAVSEIDCLEYSSVAEIKRWINGYA